MELAGYISEVFGSFQGEGPHVGERHVFARFCRCSLGCVYCDTRGSAENVPEARLQDGPDKGDTWVANPVGVGRIVEAVLAQESSPGFNSALSITGGEPLEQPDFLRALLEALGGRFRVILETNGVHAGALSGLGGLVDEVSMDIKLPSVSGLGPLWVEHAGFLRACRGIELVVKAVVSNATDAAELAHAAGLVADHAPDSIFVIQPLTRTEGRPEVDEKRLFELYRAAKAVLGSVRVIPQVHKMIGVR